ncbi:MAG: hypothetical protein ACRDKA_10740 [Actinomycetota bacterium]
MKLGQLLLQTGPVFEARLLSVPEGLANLSLEHGRPQRVEELGADDVDHEIHKAVVAEPGPALLALP